MTGIFYGSGGGGGGGGGGPPTGGAGGDLAGSYPNPNVAAVHETSGPTKLTIGAVADGQVLTRSGNTLVGTTPGSGPPSGAAGGDLASPTPADNYPNPQVVAVHNSDDLRLTFGAIPNNFFLKRFNNTIIGTAPPTESPWLDDGIEIHQVDTTKNVIVGPGVVAKAQLHLTRTFMTETLVLPTAITSDGPIGDAADTVDIATSIKISTGSTKGVQLTIPNPTDETAIGRRLTLSCGGSGSFIIAGKYLIETGKSFDFIWDGFTWSPLLSQLRTDNYLSITNASTGVIGGGDPRISVDTRHGAIINNTSSATLTLPSPTNEDAVKRFTMVNIGTATVTVSGGPGNPSVRLPTQTAVEWYWAGAVVGWLPGGENHTATGWTLNGAGTAIIPYVNTLDVAVGTVLAVSGAFTIAKPIVLTSQTRSDYGSSGSFGTAATTVNIATAFRLTQSTPGVSLTLENASPANSARWAVIINDGSVPVTVDGVLIPVGGHTQFFWDGTSWSKDAASTGRSPWSVTSLKTTDYTASINEHVRAKPLTSTPITITLPVITADMIGKEVSIKRVHGSNATVFVQPDIGAANLLDDQTGPLPISGLDASATVVAVDTLNWETR